MSAAVLREAAALMRERALAVAPSPWEAGEHCVWSNPPGPDFFVVVSDGQAGDGGCAAEENAEHIASWHPAVALAVADWLDTEANHLEGGYGQRGGQALAVARAYLNTT